VLKIHEIRGNVTRGNEIRGNVISGKHNSGKRVFGKMYFGENSPRGNVPNTFFCDVTKVKNFDKKCLTLSKENRKSPYQHICLGRPKSPVKGLSNVVNQLKSANLSNLLYKRLKKNHSLILHNSK
jgi:hypothetical protein